MLTRKIGVPEEIADFFRDSRLAGRVLADQVRVAPAIHLFLEGIISIGKAAELSGEPRVDFEWLLTEMGIPTAHYDVADYEQDLRGVTEAQRRRGIS